MNPGPNPSRDDEDAEAPSHRRIDDTGINDEPTAPNHPRPGRLVPCSGSPLADDTDLDAPTVPIHVRPGRLVPHRSTVHSYTTVLYGQLEPESEPTSALHLRVLLGLKRLP